MVYKDCVTALEMNGKYVKAMERKAKACRKQAQAMTTTSPVAKFREALEDITGVCILEGFQRQDNIMLVDQIIKDLGRAEAKEAAATREPMLTSKHFIQQYFLSFAEDPVIKSLEKENEGDVDENESVEADNSSR